MYFAGLTLPAGAALAPMAGVSDAALRRLCSAHGAIFTVSEMVSAKALAMGDKKSRTLLLGGGGQAPYGAQLFGYEPQAIAEAIHLIEDIPYDFLDINMGCPAPKIVSHGAGSALLRNPVLAQQIAAAAVKASTRPVTVKLRIGWDDAHKTGLEVAKRCEAAGVTGLVVHARTREQQYKPGVDYAAVAAIKAAVGIPVLYNGDVTDAKSALYAIAQTGCDGLMVGRGAMGNPWVFAEIQAALAGAPLPLPPTLSQRFDALQAQVQALVETRGEDAGMRAARGVAGSYMKGLKGAASLRHAAYSLEKYTDLNRLIADAYDYQHAAGIK